MPRAHAWLSPRARSLRRVADPLLAVLVALNLLWPTSAPLRANGIPINTWPEYALASIGLGWLGLLLSFAVLRRIDPGVTPARRFAGADRILTAAALVLGLSLLLVRALEPAGDGFAACYSTPERSEVPCLFLADGWTATTAGRDPRLSRREEQILFDARRGGPWRLGAFNDLAFNVYGAEPDTREARREDFRKDAAHPVAVTFAWGEATGERLARLYPSGAQIRIDYRGEAGLATDERTERLRFRRRERTEVIDLRPAELRSLRLRYANFSCPDDACRRDLTMDALPLADAVFRVSLAPPGAPADQAKPLDLHLLGRAAEPSSPVGWGRPIEVAFVLVALARLAAWVARLGLARRPGRYRVVVAGLLVCGLAGLFALVRAWWPEVASHPKHGSLPDVDRNWTLVLAPAFVLTTLPVVLAVGGVLVAVVLRRRSAVETTAPALLVLATAVLLMQVPAALATAARAAPGAPVGRIAAVDRALDGFALPPRDDTVLFDPGTDQLTYAAWAKDVLRSPRRFVDPTVVVSKPFFMYLRAARYAVLGDGEVYALALYRAVICWVIAVGGILCLAALGTAGVAGQGFGGRFRAGTGVLAVLTAAAWTCLSFGVTTAPGFYARLSEGPATTAALLSFGLLIGGMGRGPAPQVAAGALFGLSLFYRTSNLPLALLGLGIVCLGSGLGPSGWLRAASAYVLPIAAAVLAIWLHAGAPLGLPPGVAEYVAANTEARGRASEARAQRGSYVQGLVPNGLALLLLGSALVAVVAALVVPVVTAVRVRVGVLGLVVVLLLVPLLPQRDAPAYPRSLMTTYYALAFVPMALLVCGFGSPPSHVAGAGTGASLRH